MSAHLSDCPQLLLALFNDGVPELGRQAVPPNRLGQADQKSKFRALPPALSKGKQVTAVTRKYKLPYFTIYAPNDFQLPELPKV